MSHTTYVWTDLESIADYSRASIIVNATSKEQAINLAMRTARNTVLNEPRKEQSAEFNLIVGFMNMADPVDRQTVEDTLHDLRLELNTVEPVTVDGYGVLALIG